MTLQGKPCSKPRDVAVIFHVCFKFAFTWLTVMLHAFTLRFSFPNQWRDDRRPNFTLYALKSRLQKNWLWRNYSDADKDIVKI